MTHRTERELIEEALQVQDACNLSGVVHSFSRAMTDLWEIAREKGEGTHFVNTHRVSVLYADKCRHLSEATPDRVSDAYDVLGLMIDGQEVSDG